MKQLINELARFSPAEAVVNEAAFFDETLHTFLQDKLNCHLESCRRAASRWRRRKS